MFYLVQYNNDPDYETFHADDYAHALEQARDSRDVGTGGTDYISAVFQCLELGENGEAIFPSELQSLARIS